MSHRFVRIVTGLATLASIGTAARAQDSDGEATPLDPIVEDAVIDTAVRATELAVEDALGRDAVPLVGDAYDIYRVVSAPDANVVVDVVRERALEAAMGPWAGIFATTDTAPAAMDEDTSGPLFQAPSEPMPADPLIIEPVDDPAPLEIEPVEDPAPLQIEMMVDLVEAN